jgi:hypothetical protein
VVEKCSSFGRLRKRFYGLCLIAGKRLGKKKEKKGQIRNHITVCGWSGCHVLVRYMKSISFISFLKLAVIIRLD